MPLKRFCIEVLYISSTSVRSRGQNEPESLVKPDVSQMGGDSAVLQGLCRPLGSGEDALCPYRGSANNRQQWTVGKTHVCVRRLAAIYRKGRW